MANLRIPGPTPLPPQVLSSLSQQVISHRGKSYEKIHQEVVDNLQYFFQTKNPIYLLTASGTAGLETAVVNFFSPGDTVVFFTCGEFGNRWAEIGKRYDLNINQVKFPEGTAVKKEIVQQTLQKIKKLAAVFITHNETGTGVLNNLFEIAPIVKAHSSKPLLLVDSVSALGGVNLPMDDLKIDVLITASQKAWMSSPGISMIAVSEKAKERQKNSKIPKYYFDLSLYEKFSQKNQTPATPAVSVLFSLKTALEIMRKQGREKIFKKHLELRDYFRGQIKKIGLKLVVTDKEASPTVTSIWPPEGVDEASWRKLLREKYNLVIAGGMGDLKGKIVRVAHMGYVTKSDLNQVVDVFKKSLKEV
ncbi:MAG: Phosphoserine aminotransferase apoenzyme / L-aspartate aminotransferase apoenzyme [Candidatus Roizmanbacteria bacterium GW2011_GWA2_33_33]|uniref:Phosphoserine aminotransferase apoenzyme / L-aspartate aminotransferase apoenzyme n=2 Tax=Candidatus Roizmaniibacteriota TaxID=1752723 RepID=A0A0G0E3Q8_9BACT|nr:MAG: Phosphoserine aminotransferase apoenzyme / L-aspartate aminotransferase apoenzyme [Candidatus Roizmanbacteria bacterium GW2011_GWA2_33_33]KKP62022.1 MAG: Phosphoserine aminotransferase apoenzyme / L-aspartate aminotransferase apoenzyme [Candidatus Roizmanbacteria bacterium GW2011_GWC2_34_23]